MTWRWIPLKKRVLSPIKIIMSCISFLLETVVVHDSFSSHSVSHSLPTLDHHFIYLFFLVCFHIPYFLCAVLWFELCLLHCTALLVSIFSILIDLHKYL